MGRGFQTMPEDWRKQNAAKGGKRAHELGKAHAFTSEEARAAGKTRNSRRERTINGVVASVHQYKGRWWWRLKTWRTGRKSKGSFATADEAWTEAAMVIALINFAEKSQEIVDSPLVGGSEPEPPTKSTEVLECE